ncbi:MAG: hypothetical protein ACPL7B_07280 [Candidatus Poribacteria bacterium]
MDEMFLYPFLPLMKGGKNILEESEQKIYENTEIEIVDKVGLLTANRLDIIKEAIKITDNL